MKHQMLYNDSKINLSWKLFIKKGIINREVVRNKIAYNWERARLCNVNYESKSFAKNFKTAFIENLKLTTEIKKTLRMKKINCFLVNSDLVVIDRVVDDQLLDNVVLGYQFNDRITGNLSIFNMQNSTEYEYVAGSEHYLSCLHQLVDICHKIEFLKNTYYVLFFVDFCEYDKTIVEMLVETCKKLVKIWCAQNKNIPKESFDLPTIIEIDNVGSVLNIKNSVDNSLKIGANLHEIFEGFDLKEITCGSITVCGFKKNNTKKVAFLSIDKKSHQSTFIIIGTNQMCKIADELNLFNSSFYKLEMSMDFSKRIELERVFKNMISALLIANSYDTLYKNLKYLLKKEDHNKFYTIDFSILDSNFFEGILVASNMNNHLGVLDYFNNGVIVIIGVERINSKNQIHVLNVIKRHTALLKENNVKIVFLVQFIMNKNITLAKQFLDFHRLNTVYLNDESNDVIKQISNNFIKIPQNDIKNGVMTMQDIERSKIIECLKINDDNISMTARQLNIGRATLYRKIKKYHISHVSK